MSKFETLIHALRSATIEGKQADEAVAVAVGGEVIPHRRFHRAVRWPGSSTYCSLPRLTTSLDAAKYFALSHANDPLDAFRRAVQMAGTLSDQWTDDRGRISMLPALICAEVLDDLSAKGGKPDRASRTFARPSGAPAAAGGVAAREDT